ncbi:hypothetical protein EJ05DRAFT_475786 [Pseudovirgaria hyperparasitica]|uniref:Rhodopsin domain-containing protein n=1 Tax=Pseudovirgaria hyperparasitica TaxID=470096 RepID=A0A6A6WA62_9PEZI|nr:uncharacterized protein EJ05DRAFT_475786 [Pseudovirgaria hyperparasitica]KAF2758477.1 hypothetical protein EJ05DRAFT_475786 [Pseudovirgaria hyperparasitica]
MPTEIPPGFYDDSSNQLIVTAAVFLALNQTAVILRFISRQQQKTPWYWDDFLMVLAWLTVTGLCIDGLLAPRWGAGRRIAWVMTNEPEQIPNFGRNAFYAVPITFTIASVLPKISVLVLYLRIFIDKFSRIACWILIAALGIATVINCFLVGFQCNGQEYSWELTKPGRHCLNFQALLIWGPFINIVTDVAMLLLPIPVVRKLQVSNHVRLGLYATFLIASVGLITSVIRFAQFFLNEYSSDPTWYASPLILWVIVEASIYLISACLLTYRPILAKLVYSKQMTSAYEWLRRTTSNVLSSRSRNSMVFDQTTHATERDSSEPSLLSKGSSDGTRSFEMDRDLPRMPGQIHVRHDVRVTAQHSRV